MTIATRHTMDYDGARLLRVERRRAVAPSRLLQHWWPIVHGDVCAYRPMGWRTFDFRL